MQLYSCTYTVTARKNSRFILSKRSDFHMVVDLLVAVYAISMRMFASLWIDKILLPRYMNWSTNVFCHVCQSRAFNIGE